jgi:hypothetical protein
MTESNMRKFSFFLLVTVVVLCQAVVTRAEETKSWTDKIKISGDFRYRHEFISQEYYRAADSSKVRGFDRNRHRIRVRLGLTAQVSPSMDAVFRLASSTFTSIEKENKTAAGDPISTNQDLSGGFAPKPLWIDRAYADWHPTQLKWLDARAGRQPVPFEFTDLVWDPDLDVEGISALLSHKMDKHELFLRAGGYWVNELGPSSYTKHALDQGVFEGQIGGKLTMDKASVQLAVAYIDYGNVKGNPTLYAHNNGFGNSLVPVAGRGNDTLGYKYDFNLINVNGNVKFKLDKVEPTLLFDFVTNGDAETDPAYNKTLGTSWLAGVSFKFSKLPFDWDFAYNYRDQQKDATIGAFADSDPGGGGTNYNGHKASIGVAVLPGTRLAATYFKNVKDPENLNSKKQLDYDRVQADLEVKF